MVLWNCESWIGISKRTLKILDNLFHTFCQSILRVGVGCPIPSYYIESSSLKMENLIIERKLNFAFHLANLSPDSLGGMIWREQVEKSLPGLYPEIAPHLEKMGINNLHDHNKWTFKKSARNMLGIRILLKFLNP